MIYKISLFILVAYSSITMADDSVDALFELSLEQLQNTQVITAASGFEQKLNEAPASVTVIEAKDWRARGAQNLVEALRGTLSLNIESVAVGPTHNKFNFRGLSGDFGQQVKLLIDGVPINRVFTGGMLVLTEFPLSGFKRIEIIRNPGSAVYGADAFAGIINLVSWGKDQQPNEVRISGGSFDTYSVNATTTWSGEEASLQVAVNYQHYGEDPNRIVSRDLQSLLDEIFGTNASLAPGLFDQSHEDLTVKAILYWNKFELNYYGVDYDFTYGAGTAQALDRTRGNAQSHILSAKYDFSEHFKGKFLLNSWYQYKSQFYPYKIFPPGAVIPIGKDGNANFNNPTSFTLFTDGFIGEPGANVYQYHIDLSHLFKINENHLFRWSIGFEHARYNATETKNFGPGVLLGNETVVDGTVTEVAGTEYIFAPDLSRSFSFLSLQEQWKINENIKINIGSRIDRYSDFGTTVNYRLGLNWTLDDRVNIRMFAGTAFRAPSFADTSARNNPVSLGNAEVKPEDITTSELALDYHFSENFLSTVTLFKYKAKKLIDFVSNPDTGEAHSQNVGELNGDGIEWEIKWRAAKEVDVSANFSHLNSTDKNGIDTPDIADNLININLNWRITPQLNFNAFGHWVKGRKRLPTDPREDIEDYTWVTSKLNYSNLDANLNIALVLNNLLDDKKAANPSTGAIPDDYPLQGRQWRLELSYRF